ALLATGQPVQPPADKKPGEKKAADKKAADPVAPLVAAALANDPDVRMAGAKIQLAEAELAKARQQATQKVVTLHSGIEDQKRALAGLRESYRLVEQSHKAGVSTQTDLLTAREKLETAQSA